jgi:type II secretory pathway component PulC
VYFRFPQQYIAVLNLFLIGIIVYFLALAVSNGIKLHLARAAVSGLLESNHQKPLQQPQAGLRPRAYYDMIVQRNIFSLAPVAPAPAPVANENLNITLIGTSHLSVGKPYIIVETPDGEQSLYRQGETIPNVGRVLSISRSQAIVLHNGHRVALQIPNAGEGGTPEPAPPYGLPGPRRFMGFPRFRRPGPGAPFGPYGALNSNAGVHRLTSNRYLIGRVTVDRSLSNMGSLIRQIRAVPNLQNGSSTGFRLSRIQPGSIFQQIGLEDGDIVTGAQDQQVNDPMRAMMLLNTLRNSPSISLSLIRNGSPMRLYYTIH